jgi:hypothetical protein
MNLQLAPSIHLPARPSSQPPACAFDRRSGPAFKPNLRLSSAVASAGSAFVPTNGLRLWSTLRLCLPASHRLSPAANLPASPSGQPSTCADCQPSGSAHEPNLRLSSVVASSGAAFRPISDLRLRPTFRLPSGQSPTCVFDQPSGYLPIQSLTFVSDQPSGSAFKHNLRLDTRSSVEETVGVGRLWMQVQNFRFLWILSGALRRSRKPMQRQAELIKPAWLEGPVDEKTGTKAWIGSEISHRWAEQLTATLVPSSHAAAASWRAGWGRL